MNYAYLLMQVMYNECVSTISIHVTNKHSCMYTCTVCRMHMYMYIHACTREAITIGLVMIAPRRVNREEKPRGVHTDISNTPNMETRE